MLARRRHPWLTRIAKGQLVLGLFLLVLSAASYVWYFAYQQPPAAVVAKQPDGSMVIVSPAGNIRFRFLAGSLIVANGPLPWNSKVKVSLGSLRPPGFTVSTVTSPWANFINANTWRYYFQPEHIQVQFIPIGAALMIPWFLFRRPRPYWMCQACGYDLRGNSSTQCSECGAAREPVTTPR